jgi:hypothetical protein
MRALRLAILLLAFAAPAAQALEPGEAEAVTRILERLSQETSDSVLIGEANFWFELDAEIDGLIGAAGFNEGSWRRAYDETLSGLLASIEQAEFDATIAAPVEMLAASPHLTEAQKAEILADFQVSMDELAAERAAGAAHRQVVAPYADRLRRLVFE